MQASFRCRSRWSYHLIKECIPRGIGLQLVYTLVSLAKAYFTRIMININQETNK